MKNVEIEGKFLQIKRKGDVVGLGEKNPMGIAVLPEKDRLRILLQFHRQFFEERLPNKLWPFVREGLRNGEIRALSDLSTIPDEVLQKEKGIGPIRFARIRELYPFKQAIVVKELNLFQ